MERKYCSLCGVKLIESNDSDEHLLPNAIGGRLKVRGFVCKDCNNETGESWDAELARQLNPLSLILGIKRDRKRVPSQDFPTIGGENLTMHADGSFSPSVPVFSKKKVDEGFEVNLIARSVKEARQMLKGVARKHPRLNVEKVLSEAKEVSSYSNDPLQVSLNFGGPLAGRSVVKSALCLAVKSGVDSRLCGLANDYLLKEDAEACFGYYYERDLVRNRPKDKVIHCVAVEGCQKSNLLLGYVELYSVYKMVVCLSNSYQGKDFSKSYAINPVEGEMENVKVDLKFEWNEVKEIYEYKKYSVENARQCFDKVIGMAMQRRHEEERDRVLSSAVEYAFKNCGAEEGEVLERDHLAKVADLMMERMKPFLLHVLSRGRKL